MNTSKKERTRYVLFLFGLFIVFLPSSVFGSDTGWRFPKQSSTTGGTDWKNPDNSFYCDGNYSSYSGLDTADTLFTFEYMVNLPASAVIDSLWYMYNGYGSGGGDNIVRIGFMAGQSRNLGSEFYLAATAHSDSAGLTVFSHDTVTVACVNSTSFGLYVVTAGDELLAHTYIDCLAIKVFYHIPPSVLRRQRLLKTGE